MTYSIPNDDDSNTRPLIIPSASARRAKRDPQSTSVPKLTLGSLGKSSAKFASTVKGASRTILEPIDGGDTATEIESNDESNFADDDSSVYSYNIDAPGSFINYGSIPSLPPPPVSTLGLPDNTQLEYESKKSKKRSKKDRSGRKSLFVKRDRDSTTSQKELKVLGKYSTPLVVTFLLQQSLTTASVFSVGHLGKTELAAVSLATMTANITGYAIIQGVATCLDTLCPQAYGRGDHKAVGLNFLRCTILLMCIYAFISLFWINSQMILDFLIPGEPELNRLAATYLRVLILGTPGYCIFENLKHFLQAQGIFQASTYVLIICAPLNILLNYLLVWNSTVGIGYLGAPTAVVCTDWLMAIMLGLYAAFINGYQCWCGFDRTIFQNWGRMIELSIPGVIMIEAEWLAFEILTLAAAKFGTTSLATQSVVTTICSLTYQIPFAVSIAASTRVASYIGSNKPKSAIITSAVSLKISLFSGLLIASILYLSRNFIGAIFSNDKEVIEYVAEILPYGALYQINDFLGCVSGGILRGQGRQSIGGWLNIFFYYVVALPFAILFGFKFGWGLAGLWIALVGALFFVSTLQTYFVIKSDWDTIIDKAREDGKREAELSQSHQP
ncbi:MATE efflux family protein [Nadsonia fulvescens var. elongata DSM 6958]|uniref:MATE efflux family protein n=1 Tax=Nadsonia fulvescens var. elongata DSM 6958 TaxID=857566 RepID=A0A1E3PII8_9ASCO|nr:MATE efflux family protein [Nadsonia fulvescens var. elongata DSM 6958]